MELTGPRCFKRFRHSVGLPSSINNLICLLVPSIRVFNFKATLKLQVSLISVTGPVA